MQAGALNSVAVSIIGVVGWTGNFTTAASTIQPDLDGFSDLLDGQPDCSTSSRKVQTQRAKLIVHDSDTLSVHDSGFTIRCFDQVGLARLVAKDVHELCGQQTPNVGKLHQQIG